MGWLSPRGCRRRLHHCLAWHSMGAQTRAGLVASQASPSLLDLGLGRTAKTHVCTRRGQPSAHLPCPGDPVHPAPSRAALPFSKCKSAEVFFFPQQREAPAEKGTSPLLTEWNPSNRFTCSQQTNAERNLFCACLRDAEKALPPFVAVVTHAAAPSWLHFYLPHDLLFGCNTVVCKHSAALPKSSHSNPPWADGCVTLMETASVLGEGTDSVSWQFSRFPESPMDQYRTGAKCRPWFYWVELGLPASRIFFYHKEFKYNSQIGLG